MVPTSPTREGLTWGSTPPELIQRGLCPPSAHCPSSWEHSEGCKAPGPWACVCGSGHFPSLALWGCFLVTTAGKGLNKQDGSGLFQHHDSLQVVSHVCSGQDLAAPGVGLDFPVSVPQRGCRGGDGSTPSGVSNDTQAK